MEKICKFFIKTFLSYQQISSNNCGTVSGEPGAKALS